MILGPIAVPMFATAVAVPVMMLVEMAMLAATSVASNLFIHWLSILFLLFQLLSQ
jgi:hypothetical protein